jgi:hypothetical protein
MNRALVSMIATLALAGCGEDIDSSGGRRNTPKQAEPVAPVTESEITTGETTVGSNITDPKPAPPTSMPGWLDEGTGYRFVLLEDEGEVTWELADAETEQAALYMDMSKAELKAAEEAKEAGDAAFTSLLQTLTPIVPEAGVILQVKLLLDQFGVDFAASQTRRKSLCERTLKSGWHVPAPELVKNALEDGLIEAIPEAAATRVWLAVSAEWFTHDMRAYKLPVAPSDTTGDIVDLDPKTDKAHVLCVARDHSVKN